MLLKTTSFLSLFFSPAVLLIIIIVFFLIQRSVCAKGDMQHMYNKSGHVSCIQEKEERKETSIMVITVISKR